MFHNILTIRSVSKINKGVDEDLAAFSINTTYIKKVDEKCSHKLYTNFLFLKILCKLALFIFYFS